MNIGLAASQAAKAYLAGLSLTTVTNFYAEVEDPENAEGTAANNRDLPCVICFCGPAEEFPMFTGNYNTELHFRIMASADDHTAAQMEAIFDEVWENISTNTILADISAGANEFTAFGFTDGIRQTPQTVEDDPRLGRIRAKLGRIRAKSIVLLINCCAADIA